ncbi:MAG: YdjY domain-containing protein [Phycisphaerales bacterium]
MKRGAAIVVLALLAGCSRPNPYVHENMPSVESFIIGCPAAPEPAAPVESPPGADASGSFAREAPSAPAGLSFVELAPGLRLDARAKVVEFDGSVAVDAHDPRTPDVYLELLVCAPDTREHESLVVTSVPASAIHAALLAAGLDPGGPGRVVQLRDGTVERRPATGDGVRVEFMVQDATGAWRAHDPASWVMLQGSKERADWGGLVFAGSRFVMRGGRERYDADGTGVIVGLTTFGSEVIAPVRAVSPDSWVDDPAWVADADAMPARGTPVRVRVSAIK